MRFISSRIPILAFFAFPSLSFAASYSVLTIGYLGSPNPLTGETYIQNRGLQLNNLGEVIGDYVQPGGPGGFTTHGFRTSPNSAFNPATDDIGYIASNGISFYSSALSLNNKGEVLGDTFAVDGVTPVAFRTDSSGKINANTVNLGNIDAEFLNDREQIAGGHGGMAFRTQPGQAYNSATDNLGTFHLDGLNNIGQVLGHTGSAGTYFLTLPDGPARGTALGPSFVALALNDVGQTAGFFGPDIFLTSGNQPAPNGIDFGSVSSGNVFDVSTNSDFVGWVTTTTAAETAFIGIGNQLIDLNSLIDPSSGIILTQALQINDNGQILAYTAGTTSFPAGSVVLLTPVPEPTYLVALLAASTLTIACRRRHAR